MVSPDARHDIALFIDFENIALGLRDRPDKTFDIQKVLERLLEKGKIIVKRAYADWSRFSAHTRCFHEAAIELIEIPGRGTSGKKGAKVGDALRGGISLRCSDAVNSLPRNGYATCQRLPLRRCLIHSGFPRTR